VRFWPSRSDEPSDEPFVFDTRDPVDPAFEDYQQSINELLDKHPERSAELARRLDAATAKWERRTFRLITKPLRRDREFRAAIRSVLRSNKT
jgi:hypothetical protein